MLVTHDSETPARGQQVITACAFIHRKFDDIEKVFLPRRASTKKFLPNVYELPGGHIEYGEDIIEGLKRELREEFKMEIKIGDPFYVFTYKNDVKGSHSIEVIYFASFVTPIEDIKLNPEDHSEYSWFTFNEIKEKIVNSGKNETDDEIKGILRGFSLLENHVVNLA